LKEFGLVAESLEVGLDLYWVEFWVLQHALLAFLV
jgi:hypothetical protein